MAGVEPKNVELNRQLMEQNMLVEDKLRKVSQENARLQALIIRAQSERDVALNELNDRDGTGRIGWLRGDIAGMQFRVPLYFGSPRVEMWDGTHQRWYRSMWEILDGSAVAAKVELGP